MEGLINKPNRLLSHMARGQWEPLFNTFFRKDENCMNLPSAVLMGTAFARSTFLYHSPMACGWLQRREKICSIFCGILRSR